MGLEKAIKHNKEYRQEFRRSKRFSKSCRNHGGCPYCELNRLHSFRKREKIADIEIKNYKKGEIDGSDY